jgi:hypothetical protein
MNTSTSRPKSAPAKASDEPPLAGAGLGHETLTPACLL